MRAAAIALLALAAAWPSIRWWRVPIAVGGAALLVASTWDASFAGRDNQWAVVAGAVVAIALWWAVPIAHERLVGPGPLHTIGVAWWGLLGSAIAVYGCVPETDQMREVGVVVAAGGLAELLLRRRLPTPALVAAAAYVEWSALYGATGRGRALVGGLFALTPLIAVAVFDAKRRSWLLGLVWVVAAVVMARTGGIATSLRPALVAAAICGAVALAVSALLVRRPR